MTAREICDAAISFTQAVFPRTVGRVDVREAVPGKWDNPRTAFFQLAGSLYSPMTIRVEEGDDKGEEMEDGDLF